jgi:hypothetical protein
VGNHKGQKTHKPYRDGFLESLLSNISPPLQLMDSVADGLSSSPAIKSDGGTWLQERSSFVANFYTASRPRSVSEFLLACIELAVSHVTGWCHFVAYDVGGTGTSVLWGSSALIN